MPLVTSCWSMCDMLNLRLCYDVAQASPGHFIGECLSEQTLHVCLHNDIAVNTANGHILCAECIKIFMYYFFVANIRQHNEESAHNLKIFNQTS